MDTEEGIPETDRITSNQVKVKDKKETDKWTILSFDIGVKNLAYCMMNWDPTLPDGNRYNIIHWDVVNLIPESENPSCEGIVRYRGKRARELGYTQKVCGKVASFHYKMNNNETVDMESGVNNKIYNLCGTHLPDKTKGIPIKTQKINKVSNQELNLALVRELNKIPFFLECDEILLEHQPSKGHPRMKNLSFMLYSFFVIRGFLDNPESRLKNIQIRQINSVKKLSLYNGPVINCDLKNQYDKNKFYSKKYCAYLIRDNTDWLEFYEKTKKKDDLADCLLQGAWFLNKHHNNGRKMTKIKKKVA